MKKKIFTILIVLIIVFAFAFKINPKMLDGLKANVLVEFYENYIHWGNPFSHENRDAFSEEYAYLSIDEKLSLLKKWLPAGKYWNEHGLTDEDLPDGERLLHWSQTPCVDYEETYCHRYSGSFAQQYYGFETIQCLGFASFVSDFLFGQNAPVIEVQAGFENIKIGDHLRFKDIPHSVIVIDKNETEIFVVEVNRNYDCLIEWGRSISKEELEDINYYILTRN